MQELENTIGSAQGNEDEQVLSFRLGGEEYAVDILRVQEIKGWEKTTPIPNTPDYVMGVINLRGAVVPIIDLRVRFKLDDITYNESTVVIIVRAFDSLGTQKIIGLVVDGVSDVHSIHTDHLQNAPEMSGVIHSSYLKGLATLDDKMVIVLNIDQLINEGILGDISALN
ncbi:MULTISPECIES: chemotaxis protein CheW [Thiomicrorhabdus]|uniref:Chemotaxis protein CheW n=1 Tax=Thiomicrorhabdus heinhorstiae TaxID=2748010 RepID=A0ABS0BX20_9GAMM|nr:MULTISPECIES: chemotaxis protein CheW [Thiomicrorhabdus]MBF6058353.1 purine-binding chemotaxis protein CheW [Thiomicrorhabdus heinhorstiae]